MFDVGDTVGSYEVVSRLSEGGMAALLLGRRTDEPDAPPVAIKVIRESLSEDWQFVRMFVDEALISVRIRHPNVVRVDELGEQDNVYYLVMEYVAGCSLAQLMRAMAKRGRRMRPEIAVWIAQQVAAGLHAAHEMTGHDGALLGVVHRDVSPQNVLLSVDGGVKLLDFGIAKARGRAERTEAGVIKGKIRYMAPEQASGRDIDRRIDIYALGVVLWEMLTMRRYIEGKSEIEILRRVQSPEPVPPGFRVSGIDPRIDDAVMAAIAPRCDDRPATALELHDLLSSAVPAGTVGPAHLAELLRLFVADEIEAAAQALPAEVGAPLAARVRGVTELPGDTAGVDDRTRVESLTAVVQGATYEAADRSEPTKEAKPKEERAVTAVTRAAVPQPAEDAAEPADSSRPTQKVPEELADDVPAADEEATIQADPSELAAFLESVRAAERAAAAPVEEADEEDESGPGLAGWALRVLVITAVAFVLGAGIAIAWMHLAPS